MRNDCKCHSSKYTGGTSDHRSKLAASPRKTVVNIGDDLFEDDDDNNYDPEIDEFIDIKTYMMANILGANSFLFVNIGTVDLLH